MIPFGLKLKDKEALWPSWGRTVKYLTLEEHTTSLVLLNFMRKITAVQCKGLNRLILNVCYVIEKSLLCHLET